eukprot:14161145-Alexandrium_andersonii.AAC.1
MAMGTIATTPAAMMAKPSLLEAFVRGSPWPSLGLQGSACAAACAWCTSRGGSETALAGGPIAHAYVCAWGGRGEIARAGPPI